MTTRREILALAALAAPLQHVLAQPAAAIRIGEINSYSTIPQFTIPYRMGWQLAVEEVNARRRRARAAHRGRVARRRRPAR
jgi:branched-chain amino acid transport system substrate-binding protein